MSANLNLKRIDGCILVYPPVNRRHPKPWLIDTKMILIIAEKSYDEILHVCSTYNKHTNAQKIFALRVPKSDITCFGSRTKIHDAWIGWLIKVGKCMCYSYDSNNLFSFIITIFMT